MNFATKTAALEAVTDAALEVCPHEHYAMLSQHFAAGNFVTKAQKGYVADLDYVKMLVREVHPATNRPAGRPTTQVEYDMRRRVIEKRITRGDEYSAAFVEECRLMLAATKTKNCPFALLCAKAIE